MASPGIHGPQAFWNPGADSQGSAWNLLYVAGAGTRSQPTSLTKMEAYNMSNLSGVFSSTQGDPDNTPINYPWPGTIPVVSWNSLGNINGSTVDNGVLWAIDPGAYGYWKSTAQSAQQASPAILYAYYGVPQVNAQKKFQLSEVYASNVKSTDAGPGAVKFTVPTVANGLVFVGGGASVVVNGVTQGYAPGPVGGTNVNCTGVTLTSSNGNVQQCLGALYVYGQLQ